MKIPPLLTLLLSCCGLSLAASQPLLRHSPVPADEMTLGLEKQMDTWAQETDAFIATLPEEEATPLPPEPTHSNDTIIESTKGLYFDAGQSTLNYFGQVRLRDPRLKLDCERLYVQLEQESVQEKGGKMSEQVDKPQNLNLAPSKDAQEKVIMAESKGFTNPVSMLAQLVLIDMAHKKIFAKGETIVITHSKGEMRATGGRPIALLADQEGIIYMRGEQIEGYTINEQGERSEFSTQGYALYELESDSISLAQHNKVKTAQAELTSRGSLTLYLQAEEQQAEQGEKSLRLNRAYAGLARMTAMDEVKLKAKNKAGEDVVLCGQGLNYDATSGEVRLWGDACLISYGEQKLKAQGSLQDLAEVSLAPDGSLDIRAQLIQGDYSRPASSSDATLIGQFETQGHVSLPASDGQLYFPNGLKAKDAEIDFSCTRELVLSFEYDESKPDLQDADQSLVLPKLPFAKIVGISQVLATGDVIAKGLGEFDFDVQGEHLEADLSQGSARLEAKPAQWAELNYQGAQLKARSEDAAAELCLQTNGDITILGDAIEATMPAKDGGASSTLVTESRLDFKSSEALLIMEHPVRMVTEQGVFSSQKGLHALLRRGEEKVAASDARYAHLNHNFIGLERADALGDCAMQTAQLSMQCDGPMQVIMSEAGQSGQDEMLSGIKQAEATGAVRFVTKDSKGGYYRATGDKMFIDGLSGIKRLTGSRVTLTSGKNMHEASGGGAQVTVDAKNNVTIRGAKQTSVATEVKSQVKHKGTSHFSP